MSTGLRFRLPSVHHLLVIGSLVVVAPLVFAVLFAAAAFDDLVDRHRTVVNQVVIASRDSLASRDTILDMERVALQYQLIGQDSLRNVFSDLYERFRWQENRLRILAGDAVIAETIGPLSKKVADLHEAVNNAPPDSERLKAALADFDDASVLAGQLNRQMQQWMDQRVEETEARISGAQRQVLVYSVLVLPMTLLLLLAFLFWVARPLNGLKAAIHRLGASDFKTGVSIHGTKDFVQLGELLDWLRIKLDESEEGKRKFLRHISHELKTPLAGLREGTDLLREEIPGPLTPQQLDVVRILQDDSVTLQRLIENLLDYNHLMSAKDVHLERISPRQMIERVVKPYRMLTRSRHVNFTLGGPDIEIMADKAKLRAALDNVISNAASFSPPDGTVDIRWERTARGIAIKVSDEGPGIATQDLKRIFEPFYQGENQRSGALKGTGLGLSIAAECLAAQKGTIHAENIAHKGACMTIELPDLSA